MKLSFPQRREPGAVGLMHEVTESPTKAFGEDDFRMLQIRSIVDDLLAIIWMICDRYRKSVFRFRLGHQLANQILLVAQKLDAGAAIGNPHDAAFDFEALFGCQKETQTHLGAYRYVAWQIPFQCGAAFGQIDHCRGGGMLRDNRVQIDATTWVMPFIDMGHVAMVPQVPTVCNGNGNATNTPVYGLTRVSRLSRVRSDAAIPFDRHADEGDYHDHHQEKLGRFVTGVGHHYRATQHRPHHRRRGG